MTGEELRVLPETMVPERALELLSVKVVALHAR
jgi:hypothetical protein